MVTNIETNAIIVMKRITGVITPQIGQKLINKLQNKIEVHEWIKVVYSKHTYGIYMHCNRTSTNVLIKT